MKHEHCNLVLSYNQMLTKCQMLTNFCCYCTFCSTTTPLGLWPAEAEHVALWKSWAWIPPWVCKPILQEEHWTAELLWRSSIRPPGVPVWVWRWKIQDRYFAVCKNMKGETVCLKIWLGWFEYHHISWPCCG